ncbi:MAG TPA: HAMP domain-containing sensor histidine kinase [Gemmatimonadota bacterium]|nr:HAMP domain-containing sensor histidine kinase [Gemmatimonadota bacterium]
MNLRSRLVVTLFVLGLILVLPSLYGLNRLVELRNIALELRGKQAEAADAIKQVQIALGELNRLARSYIVAPDAISRTAMWRALDRAEDALQRLQYAGYEEESSPVEGNLVALATSVAQIESLVEADLDGEATAHFQRTRIDLDRTFQSLMPVSEAIDRSSADAGLRAQQISGSAAKKVWVAGAISIVLAALLGFWITRALTGPIDRLKLAMAEVAEGELETPEGLPYDRPDELGDLCRSFRSMTRQLAELQRLRAEFFSVASHELKNPLNVIGGYAEILDDGQFGAVTEKQRESLRTISDQVGLLSGLVNQLLNMSRFEAGAFPLQMDTVNVSDLLAGVQLAFEALARTQEIDLSVEIDGSAPSSVTGDIDRLRNEVFGNLISNAFKFTPRGGRITVRARGSEGGLRVEVEDTGEGIPAAELTRVFEKFYQHRSAARSQGAGLGLAIARDIVEAHGGKIGVTSEVGVGTTLWFTVPVRAAGAVAEVDESLESVQSPIRDLFPEESRKATG